MTPEAEAFIVKARRSLGAASRLARDGDHDFAVSRAYYAMFYSATAMLASRQLRFSRHSALIAAFGQHLVGTGEFSAEHHAMLREAFDIRAVADYIGEPKVTEAEARALRLEVGRRLREDFASGRTYYPLHGRPIRSPQTTRERPSADYLRWHNENRYLG